MNPRQVDCIAIIGVGLIGGSFGMALKKRNLAGRVIGIGRNPQRLRRAVELQAIDSWSTELESGVRDADLVYVSTPVGLELDFIRRIAPAAKQGCIITDAGSTKAEICLGADELVRDRIHFVGAHPMAGSEAAGVEAAGPDLFVNAAYVLTPTERTNPEALAAVRGLVEAIGSRVVVMDPEVHDRCVAVISHLPHLIAAALVSLAREHSLRDPQVLDLIAGGFRDLTRVASSSPALWRDICLANAGEITEAAERFQRLLDKGLKIVESKDAEAFEKWFGSAKETRDLLFPQDQGDKKA
ncbi:MAG TPA: prephenate dehydrogenase [Armatimonadota bacterium]|nr:prephenate dehydrogenase [Armatimonadota bacterium]